MAAHNRSPPMPQIFLVVGILAIPLQVLLLDPIPYSDRSRPPRRTLPLSVLTLMTCVSSPNTCTYTYDRSWPCLEEDAKASNPMDIRTIKI